MCVCVCVRESLEPPLAFLAPPPPFTPRPLQHYNEDGYQFTVATKRNYLLHWDMAFRTDADRFVFHKFDPLNDTAGYVYLQQRYVQRKYDFTVNGRSTMSAAMNCECGPSVGGEGEGDRAMKAAVQR